MVQKVDFWLRLTIDGESTIKIIQLYIKKRQCRKDAFIKMPTSNQRWINIDMVSVLVENHQKNLSYRQQTKTIIHKYVFPFLLKWSALWSCEPDWEVWHKWKVLSQPLALVLNGNLLILKSYITRFTLKNVLSFQKTDTNVLPSSPLIFPVANLICLNPISFDYILLSEHFLLSLAAHSCPFPQPSQVWPKRKRGDPVTINLSFIEDYFCVQMLSGLVFLPPCN